MITYTKMAFLPLLPSIVVKRPLERKTLTRYRYIVGANALGSQKTSPHSLKTVFFLLKKVGKSKKAGF